MAINCFIQQSPSDGGYFDRYNLMMNFSMEDVIAQEFPSQILIRLVEKAASDLALHFQPEIIEQINKEDIVQLVKEKIAEKLAENFLKQLADK